MAWRWRRHHLCCCHSLFRQPNARSHTHTHMIRHIYARESTKKALQKGNGKNGCADFFQSSPNLRRNKEALRSQPPVWGTLSTLIKLSLPLSRLTVEKIKQKRSVFNWIQIQSGVEIAQICWHCKCDSCSICNICFIWLQTNTVSRSWLLPLYVFVWILGFPILVAVP